MAGPGRMRTDANSLRPRISGGGGKPKRARTMLFCERGTVGVPLTLASVAFDPDVAATRAVPVKMALSVQHERRDTDISRDCAVWAEGIPYDAAFSVEEVFRWRLFVFGIVGRHRHASVSQLWDHPRYAVARHTIHF